MARSTIIRMIAHAIADGFGADDATGLRDDLLIERNTSRILISLLGKRVVSWPPYRVPQEAEVMVVVLS